MLQSILDIAKALIQNQAAPIILRYVTLGLTLLAGKAGVTLDTASISNSAGTVTALVIAFVLMEIAHFYPAPAAPAATPPAK